jgi:hypothetical protein
MTCACDTYHVAMRAERIYRDQCDNPRMKILRMKGDQGTWSRNASISGSRRASLAGATIRHQGHSKGRVSVTVREHILFSQAYSRRYVSSRVSNVGSQAVVSSASSRRHLRHVNSNYLLLSLRIVTQTLTKCCLVDGGHEVKAADALNFSSIATHVCRLPSLRLCI